MTWPPMVTLKQLVPGILKVFVLLVSKEKVGLKLAAGGRGRHGTQGHSYFLDEYAYEAVGNLSGATAMLQTFVPILPIFSLQRLGTTTLFL